MPLYEYQCRDCGRLFEKIVLNAHAKVECDACHSSAVEKLFSTFAVGSGSTRPESFEPGPCNACGAPQRGLCEE